MGTPANNTTVAEYLVKQCGMKVEFAKELVEQYGELIERGQELGSFAYYVAGEIIAAHSDCDDPKWEGWDQDWEENEEEMEEEE